MIRLDPGDERIHTTRSFRVWEGGGEYNVARGLRRTFGKRAAVVTAIADNPVGRLLEDLMLQGGVSLEYVKWVPFDGIGRKTRVGLNFTERGFGIRGAVGCSDRANSAASQLKKGDIDWEKIFGQRRHPLVPHRRHLRRPLDDDAGRDHRSGHGRQEARHDRLLRPELPRLALARHRRPGEGPRGQPRDRALRRRDARQRGGLHGGAGLRGQRPGQELLAARPDELQAG